MQAAESFEAAAELFKANGVEVTVEELEKIAKKGNDELDEEMLDDVAGGLIVLLAVPLAPLAPAVVGAVAGALAGIYIARKKK